MEQGQTEGMKKDDWSRWSQSRGESERDREEKQVVILWFLSRLVLLGAGGLRPRPLLPETAVGCAGGDAGRMLIRQNANWKEARERGGEETAAAVAALFPPPREAAV